MSLIERLLRQSVSRELDQSRKKMGFWGRGVDTPHVIAGEDGIKIDQAARLSRSLPPNSPALTQAGIAWEYVWGQRPPKDISARRQKLIDKARSGQKLTPDEQIWYNLIQTDATEDF